MASSLFHSTQAGSRYFSMHKVQSVCFAFSSSFWAEGLQSGTNFSGLIKALKKSGYEVGILNSHQEDLATLVDYDCIESKLPKDNTVYVVDNLSPWFSDIGGNGLQVVVPDIVGPLDPICSMCNSLLGSSSLLSPHIYKFGQHDLKEAQIFFTTKYSLATVNLKPVVPGHCLVLPRRCTARFQDLNEKEVSDLWTSAQKVGKVLERHYGMFQFYTHLSPSNVYIHEFKI